MAGCTLPTGSNGPVNATTTSSVAGASAKSPVPVVPITPMAPPPQQVPVGKPLTAELMARYGHADAHAWGLDLPGIVRSVAPGPKTIALTFDACGGPSGAQVDEALIATLEEQGVPATLFWNKRWIQANPRRAQELAGNPLFQIENHGTSHKPLSVNGRSAYGISGTANIAELVDEIEGNRQFMREFLGVESNWFRSGTAHYDDIALRIAHDLGVSIAGFAVNGDAGATLPAPAVTKSLTHSSAGAIAIMHMNQPGHGTAEGVRAAIPQLRAAGFTFVKLGGAPLG
nr:polysaccharide deacetylase family protein [Corynebacterium lactis]